MSESKFKLVLFKLDSVRMKGCFIGDVMTIYMLDRVMSGKNLAKRKHGTCQCRTIHCGSLISIHGCHSSTTLKGRHSNKKERKRHICSS